jgi:hypothetical protein
LWCLLGAAGGRYIYGLGLLSYKPDSSIKFDAAILIGDILYLIA